jgi:hypothetical protein
MTKKALLILALTVLVSMLLSVSVFAAQAKQNAADKVSSYNVPGRTLTERQLATKDLDLRTNSASRSKAPLGQAAGTRGIGVGAEVDKTFEDFGHYYPTNTTVSASDVSGLVDIHFVYEEVPNTDSGTVKRSGYNVYDATDGVWPQGQSIGCLLQPNPARGGIYVGLTTDARGYAVMQARDAEGQFGDTLYGHDMWFQGVRHDCAWSQSWVPRATYQPSFMATTTFATQGSIATQVIGTDNITHIVIAENAYYNIHGTTIGHHPIVYFRKVGTGSAGTWGNAQIIDTNWYFTFRIVAQKNGSKVAVAFINTSDSGYAQNQAWDNDVWYRESANGGVTWGSRVNVTNYSARRTTQITGAAARDIGACYDVNGHLHIVFGAQEVPVQPYRNGWNWADFNSDIWHWSNATSGPFAGGNLSKVVDGTYDPLDNPGYWNVRHCGFGPGLNESYTFMPSVAQCGNYIYAVWGQMHYGLSLLPGSSEDSANASNDCSADVRKNNANWEVYVSVSDGIGGLLWDVPRSLTNTYTPDCHPDSGINCGNEWMPTMSLETTTDDGSLVWPANEVIPGGAGATFTSDKYLHVMYLDDEVPGSWWLGDDSGGDNPTYNSVKWIRMACVEPEGAAVILVSQNDVVWPNYVKNGAAPVVYNVTITNNGNLALEISSLTINMISGSGWLSATNPPSTIPAGSGNTGTFTITVTPPTVGTPAQFLYGRVIINSNADNNPAYPITFNLLAADKIYDVQYDTVATSNAWDSKGKGLGDNVALTVSNFGEIGNAGEGGVGLDFVEDGNDCDTTITHYLYAASPFFMHDNGSSIELTTSHYAASTLYQGKTGSWDPADSAMTGGLGTQNDASFDYVYAGKSYNRDTTVAIARTFYAPRDNASNPSFVLCKTELYSLGGAIQHMAFGTATDWDVPSDNGSLNTSAATQPSGVGGLFVYYRGTDTAGSDACQSNLNRFGAEVVAGWYAKSELAGDACANHEAIYGMLGVNVRDYFDDETATGEPDAQLWWDDLGAAPGYTGEPDQFDQGGFVTFLYDYTLPANDTLVFWTILATMHNGTLAQFEANVKDAKDWYWDLRGRCGCCVKMGNVDQSGDLLVTMGDLTVLIDHLFISFNPLACVDEGNVDMSGDGLVTMG